MNVNGCGRAIIIAVAYIFKVNRDNFEVKCKELHTITECDERL